MQDSFTGNLLALVLIIALYLSGVVSLTDRRREFRLISGILMILMLYCVTEIATCLLEGKQGAAVGIILLSGKTTLYLCNLVLEYLWIRLIAMHLGHQFSLRNKICVRGVLGFGFLLLTLNFFVPLVFRIEGNRYYRCDFYFLSIVPAVLLLAESVRFYYACKSRGGELKFFPVWAYLVPAVLGMILESVTGTSFLSVCNTIAIMMTVSSLRDESIYRDTLTGLYNRSYLDEVRSRLEHTKSPVVSGIMLDLNGFKQINDNFGHAEGDAALIQAADIIRKAVSSYGEVIRYAGDEFIVILNTREEAEIQACLFRIRRNFETYNKMSGKPYRMSASVGYANFDADTQTVNEFLNTIDKNMYEDKKEYYASSAAPERRHKKY